MNSLKVVFLSLGLTLIASCTEKPEFHFLNQSPARLSDYEGRWLVVNFWAEWCAPCQEEVPELNKLYLWGKTNNLSVIGISYDPLDNKVIQEIVTRWQIRYPVVASEPMPVFPFTLPKSLPGNYIISPEGEVVAKLQGKQTHQSISKLLINLKNKKSQSR
jgi:peroxiredoxin